MEKKIEDLTNLNYRLISFIETILSNEETCVKNGKHIYLKSLFEKEFIDILSKNDKTEDNLQGGSDKNTINIRRVIGNDEIFEENNDTEVIDIDIPKSESEPLNLINSDEIFPLEMVGGYENNDNTNNSKNVKFDNTKDKIYEIKKEPKKKDTKKAKIERRLNRLKADEVKKIGKEFNIKPTKEKKYLTKTYVIDKITRNRQIYNKILDHVQDNYDDIITETSNS
jgi:hypothetical protein